jgi:hypothetical protein
MADARQVREIELAFGECGELSKRELELCFRRLGLLELGESLNSKAYRSSLTDWEVAQGIYDGETVKAALIGAVGGGGGGFGRVARRRLCVASHNRRTGRRVEAERADGPRGSDVLTLETLERIAALRPTEAEEEEEAELFHVSQETQAIVERTEFGGQDFMSRIRALEDRRRNRIQNIRDALEETPMRRRAPEVSREKVERQREGPRRRLADEMAEPSYRPHVTPFEDYKRAARVEAKTPAGYDREVGRRRAAMKARTEEREAEERRRLEVPPRKRVKPKSRKRVEEVRKPAVSDQVTYRLVDMDGAQQREFSRNRKPDGSYTICYHVSPPRFIVHESCLHK